MSTRRKLVVHKTARHKRESQIVFNPSSNLTQIIKIPLLSNDDYQAPLTCHSLSPTSKWIIVRNNLHQIRSWGKARDIAKEDSHVKDWYLFFQMRRELKRAENQIRAIKDLQGFTPVSHFDLPIDERHVRRYNVSHVGRDDGVYYGGLGSEPIVLQYLLYYFSKECRVPYDSVLHSFLYDVNTVLDTNRQRMRRAVVFRKLALTLSIAIFIFLMVMFVTMIFSAFTTVSNLKQMYQTDLNPHMNWHQATMSLNKQ